MSLNCGIVGAPNAGKSTLFKLLTSIPVEIASYPFSTVKPNTGQVPLEDQRLSRLSEVSGSSKTTFDSLKVVDVAGLVKGASKGEGLGNQFLAQLREMEALLHVLGEFNLGGDSLEAPAKAVEQAREVNLELILADLETVEKRKTKIAKLARLGDKKYQSEQELLERLGQHLDQERPARTFPRSDVENQVIQELNLLTDKKVLYILNRKEDSIKREVPGEISEFVSQQDSSLVTISSKLELELRELEEEEKKAFQQEFDLYKDASREITKACYHLLELATFFTVKGEEARAWLIPRGTSAWGAAGKIHSDMQKGFRSVEVINWSDFIEAGSLIRAREKGSSRVEGKNYTVEDGDVLFVKF